ncbi:DUF4349 domain-containing protein [Halomarina litorea]|uniref:DUF4349 domain-containing protein n=1 Tax=Halomarina litorea TaxID=2961595 RepID=UPI0020C1EEF4|nr:DUF4349 domain-containing protein [Halomarina sp. BCD28]
MRTTGRTLAVVALVCCLVLAGCSGMGGDGGAGDGAQERQAGDGPGSGSSGGDGGGAPAQGEAETGGSVGQVAASQALIRTGTANLNVSDYDAARANLTAAATAMGGFVADSKERSHEVGNDSFTTGTVVFRVPSENFTAFFDAVTAEGEVLSATTTTEDVTDQLVDIEARLANERAQRDRLRALYENASDTEDVLAVSEKLSDVQETIERLEARLRALEGRVALSTVTVELREPRPEPATEPQASWYDTAVVDAFVSSVGGVGTLLRATVVGLAYALPYLLVVGLPLVGGLLAVRRFR